MSSEKIIVLYERLSREDENLGESYSISNQKKLLEDYCREKGWTRFRHFTDDGISGTTFAPFDIKEVREITAYDELDLGDIGRRKTALIPLIFWYQSCTHSFSICSARLQTMNTMESSRYMCGVSWTSSQTSDRFRSLTS